MSGPGAKSWRTIMVAAEPAAESVVPSAAAVRAQADDSATLAEIVCQARRCLPEFGHLSVSRIPRRHPRRLWSPT